MEWYTRNFDKILYALFGLAVLVWFGYNFSPPQEKITPYFPLVTAGVAAVAVYIATRNLRITNVKNSRDVTFKMLDRWNSDKIAQAKDDLIKDLDSHDQSKIAIIQSELYTAKANALMFERSSPIFFQFHNEAQFANRADLVKDSHAKHIEGLVSSPFSYHESPSFFDDFSSNEFKYDLPTDRNSDIALYRMWFMSIRNKLIAIRKDFIDKEHRALVDHCKPEATRIFTDGADYKINLSEVPSIEANLIKVAQVISELHVLYVDSVLDKKLARSLFVYSFSEWSILVKRFYNRANHAQDKWLKTQVMPFPQMLIDDNR